MTGYSYEAVKVSEYGRDRMRFELGDTVVEGGPVTAALTDAEIDAALEAYPKRWKRAKLFLLEHLCRNFAYQVDTRTGPLTLNLMERAKLWRRDYEALKAELDAGSSLPEAELDAMRKPPYFYTGMQGNHRAGFGGGGEV